MAIERSTKTLRDLIDYANGLMEAGLDRVRAEKNSGLYFNKVCTLAYSLREECLTRFPCWCQSFDKLLPQGCVGCLCVGRSAISHGTPLPDYAVWASVDEYLGAYREELGL